ncbi:MAG: nucleotidyltransferase family protein, partial [Acidobacteriota bacterium]
CGRGIALVVDSARRLLNTVTDGDVRRAILANLDTESPVSALLEQLEGARPTTVPVGTSNDEVLHLMRQRGLRHIPIVDDTNCVVDLLELTDLVPEESELSASAMIMAGGYGKRLRPLTDTLPKPMLPVGGRPLLELIIEKLRHSGIRDVHLATHYRGEVIEDHFADGEEFGVDIRYIRETEPLGTAGALGLLEDLDHPLLVINGDILTDVDPRALLHYHMDHKADMTVAVKEYELTVPYGTVETEGSRITDISEKPLVRCFINAGLYLIAPSVFRRIPRGDACDMPDLIRRLLAEGRPVVSFPIRESWLDVGQRADYEKALRIASEEKSH